MIAVSSQATNQPLKITHHGEIENAKFIDREVVYVAFIPETYVSKEFTFPAVSR